MKVIALMGATGAGKTTTAALLADRYQGHALAFSTSLKDAARDAGWDGVKNDAGRALIQETAERLKGEHGEEVFAARTLDHACALEGVVVIDDLRHVSELAVLTRAYNSDRLTKLILIDFYSAFAENYWRDIFFEHMRRGSKNTSWAAHRSELEWRAFRHLGRRVENRQGEQQRTVSDIAGIFDAELLNG